MKDNKKLEKTLSTIILGLVIGFFYFWFVISPALALPSVQILGEYTVGGGRTATTSDNAKLTIDGSKPLAMPDLGSSVTSCLSISSTGKVSTTTCVGIDGSGTSTQIAFFSDSDTITSSPNFVWDNTSQTLIIDGSSTYSGNVGIGTVTPNAPLEVEGALPGSVGGFQSGILHITNSDTSQYANSVITGHNASSSKQLWYLGSTTGSNDNIAFINRQSGTLSFSTNNTQRLTIDSSGNVGIATTTPAYTLDVEGTLGVSGVATFSSTASFGGVVTGVTPTASAHLATKEYVDTAIAELRFDLFLENTENSGIGDPYNPINTYTLQELNPGGSTQTLTSTSTSSGADQFLFAFSTGTDLPLSEIEVGLVDGHFHFNKSSVGGVDIVMYWTLVHRTTGGSETILATSEDSPSLTDVATAYDLHANIAAAQAIDSTDRLVVKVYADVTGGGGRTVTLSLEGDTNSHVSVTVDTGVLSSIFARQDKNLSDLDSTSTARTNLGLVIGTNVQAWGANLDTISGLATTTNNIIYGSNASGWLVTNSTSTEATILGLGSNAYNSTAYLTSAITSLNGLTGATQTFASTTGIHASSSGTIHQLVLRESLQDISGLAVTNSNFIVGDGTNWVAETGATVRTSLGLAIGSNVQAWDDDLDDIAALTPTKGDILTTAGTNWADFAIGSDGKVLTASSSATNGISWEAVTAGGIDGSGTSTQIAYWSDADTLTSNGNFTWNSTSSTFTVTGSSTFSGNVGIGTSTPQEPLHIVADSGDTVIRLEENSGGNYVTMKVDSSGNLEFYQDTPLKLLEFIRSSVQSGFYGGSESAPSVSFYDDLNTGMWGGSDKLQFSAGGVEFITLVESVAGQDELVFNEDGDDIDLRVERSGDTHALFLQGDTGFFGVATATPAYALDVHGDIRFAGSGTALYFPDGTSQTTAAAGGTAYNTFELELNPAGAGTATSSPAGSNKLIGTNWTTHTLDYDNSSDEFAFWNKKLPTFTAVNVCTFEYSGLSASTGTSTTALTFRSIAADEVYDATTNEVSATSAIAIGTANDLFTDSFTMATATIGSAEHLVFELGRDVSDSHDTLGGDFRYLSGTFYCTYR